MKIHELNNKLRRKGWRGALRLFRERFIYAHNELHWFARELNQAPLQLPRRHAWRFLDISPRMLPAFRRHFPNQVGVMADLLAQPDLHGYAALDSFGDVCAFMWISPRDYYDGHYFRSWFPVAPGDAYLFALEIAPTHRGSALFLGGQDYLWQLLGSRGYKRAVAVVDCRNRIMLRLMERLGFHEDGRKVHAHTLFGGMRFTVQPARPQPAIPVERPRLLPGGKPGGGW